MPNCCKYSHKPNYLVCWPVLSSSKDHFAEPHNRGCNLVLKGPNEDVTTGADGGCLPSLDMNTAIHLDSAIHQDAKSYPLWVRLPPRHPMWAGWKRNCDSFDCSRNRGQVWFANLRLSSFYIILQALKFCRFSCVPPHLAKRTQDSVTHRLEGWVFRAAFSGMNCCWELAL